MKKLAAIATLSMVMAFATVVSAQGTMQPSSPDLPPLPENPQLPAPEPLPPVPVTPVPVTPAPVTPPPGPVAPPVPTPPATASLPPAPPPPDVTAPAPAQKGPEFGLRTGYMLPVGSTSGSGKLGDFIAGGVPFVLDAGYRFDAQIYVGIYFGYAILFPADQVCSSGSDCHFHQIRLGAMAAYHFLPERRFDPWVGIGVGYESVAGVAGVDGTDDSSVTGIEMANIQVGADFKSGPSFRIGPFAGFALGEYLTSANGSDAGGIPDKALHGWITLGLRGAFDVNLK